MRNVTRFLLPAAAALFVSLTPGCDNAPTEPEQIRVGVAHGTLLAGDYNLPIEGGYCQFFYEGEGLAVEDIRYTFDFGEGLVRVHVFETDVPREVNGESYPCSVEVASPKGGMVGVISDGGEFHGTDEYAGQEGTGEFTLTEFGKEARGRLTLDAPLHIINDLTFALPITQG